MISIKDHDEDEEIAINCPSSIYYWLFVLDIAASFQQRDGYSNELRKLQVLLDQLDEARWIKKNIEKRSRKVSYIAIF